MVRIEMLDFVSVKQRGKNYLMIWSKHLNRTQRLSFLILKEEVISLCSVDTIIADKLKINIYFIKNI